MQRIINDSDYVVNYMVSGFLKAHIRMVVPTDNPLVVKKKMHRRYCEIGYFI